MIPGKISGILDNQYLYSFLLAEHSEPSIVSSLATGDNQVHLCVGGDSDIRSTVSLRGGRLY